MRIRYRHERSPNPRVGSLSTLQVWNERLQDYVEIRHTATFFHAHDPHTIYLQWDDHEAHEAMA